MGICKTVAVANSIPLFANVTIEYIVCVREVAQATKIYKQRSIYDLTVPIVHGNQSPHAQQQLEAGIPTYDTTIKRNCLKAQEKGLRLPTNHPKNIAFTNNVPPRTKRQVPSEEAIPATPHQTHQ